MASEDKRPPWWRRIRRPKPDLKLEELEAKLRKADRQRTARGQDGEGESNR
ncbi:MAG: hypothetical protein R3C29_08450 [Dehalococcoidia bacterium]